MYLNELTSSVTIGKMCTYGCEKLFVKNNIQTLKYVNRQGPARGQVTFYVSYRLHICSEQATRALSYRSTMINGKS
jgi:hypothetical protein